MQRIESYIGSELGFNNDTQGNIGRNMQELFRQQRTHSEAIYGTNNLAGVLSRITAVESMQADHKRIFWGMIGLVVSNLLMMFGTIAANYFVR